MMLIGCRPDIRPSSADLAERILARVHAPQRQVHEVLRATDIRRDLDRLQEVLRLGYGGRGMLEDSEFEVFLGALDALGQRQLSSESLCQDLADAFYAIPDEHLSVSFADRRCRAAEATTREGRVGQNWARSLSQEDGIPWHTRASNGVGFISITRYLPSNSSVWSGFLTQAKYLKQNAAIIIDLRGNTGGDDTSAYRLAQVLSGHFIQRDAFRVVLENRMSFALQANSMTAAIRRAQPGDDTRELHHIRDEMIAQMGEAPQNLMARARALGPGQPMSEDEVAYEGHVYVLVDRKCGSSCETGLELFTQMPRTLVVGEHTSGILHTGNSGRLELPRSGVVVRIPTQYTRYADGRFLERVGFAPSVSVPAGEDALSIALEMHAQSR